MLATHFCGGEKYILLVFYIILLARKENTKPTENLFQLNKTKKEICK
jgi:hypothetical protein